jgi:hypothetical protein
MGGGERSGMQEAIGEILTTLRKASAGAGPVGVDLGSGLAGAAGRARAAAPLFASSGGEVASPAGAARASDLIAQQATAGPGAGVELDTTSRSAPTSLADVVRAGRSVPFDAAHTDDPSASITSAPGSSPLAQLANVLSTKNLGASEETVKLARAIGDLIGGDQPPRLAPPPTMMARPAQRRAPVPMPKGPPAARSHRPLALSSQNLQAKRLRALLRLVQGAAG